jgi:hypothetical protein
MAMYQKEIEKNPIARNAYKQSVKNKDKGIWGIAANTFRDQSPIRSVLEFGKNTTPSYYYLNEPSMWQLYHTARSTAFGHRLTFGLAGDLWSNQFGLKFPNQEIDQKDFQSVNLEIREHLKKIRYYNEGFRSTAFDNEQGESAFLVFREGDGLNILREDMMSPPDITKKVIRVEAINKVDYVIPRQGFLGEPMYYKIKIWRNDGLRQYIDIHKDRVIRFRLRNYDYDQYNGQSILKACFAEIQIILNINNSISGAAFRFATGIPVVYTKGIPKEKLDDVKASIGDPTDQSWLLVQKEFIDDIKPLGLNSTTMDLNSFFEPLLSQIVVASEIPKPILLGEQTGVSRHGEVYERSYFSVLDKYHQRLNDINLYFFQRDPEIQEILAKYKIKEYEFDWGLRQVRTDQEQADLDMRLLSNVNSMMNSFTIDEMRDYMHAPDLASKVSEATAKYLYGPEWTVQMMKEVIPNLGQWRQRALEESMISQEEAFAQKMQVTEMNNQMEQATEAQTKSNPYSTPQAKSGSPKEKDPSGGGGAEAREAGRREAKFERGEAGGKFLNDADLLQTLLQEVRELRKLVQKEPPHVH